MTDKKTETELTSEVIRKETSKRIEKYEKLSFLERYAMYMGKAQILEYGLKNLLADKFDYKIDRMERWTLGRTKNELKENKLRPDFIQFLEIVVDKRNYIAHELLMNDAMYKAILKNNFPENHYSKDQRILDKSIYELEQLIFLFDWTQENNGW